jgi:hypothetical protein
MLKKNLICGNTMTGGDIYSSPAVVVLLAETTSPLLDSPEGGFDGDEGWMDEEEL